MTAGSAVDVEEHDAMETGDIRIYIDGSGIKGHVDKYK